MEMIDILNKLREFEQPVNEATITPQQIEAFKQWHEKYSKMKTKDVYNYAEGIFKAHMETGDTELDGYSRQDPEGKAYDELNAIFPEMKAEVEEIGNALRAKGIDPFSGEKFSEGTQTEGEFKKIDTKKQERARLYARLKDLKAKYNAQMAGQWDGEPEDTEEEIEKIEKELGMSQESVQEAKPDFLDLDKDGNKTEPMAKAAKDKEMKKETVQEAITMTAETPQEASVLMQILKLAGIEPKPVDDQMINQPSEQEGCGCDDNCSCGGNCGADCDCENCGKAEETYANEPQTSVKGIDAIINKGSDDLHRAKGAYVKAAGGDNPMAIGEGELSEEELSNSLRAQYESFKQAYQTEASKAKNPYAIGMAQAMKSTGDTPPLEKSTITKAHDIAKAVEKGK